MASNVSTCVAPIKGTHLRVVALDICGNPVTGASGMVVVTKGFVQVAMEPQYEDGEEFFERTADGSVCVNQKDAPTLKRMQLTIDFCEVNTAMASYMLSLRELTTGTSPNVTGWGFAVAEGQPINHFSLEVWQRVAGSGACDASGLQRYIYNAWPNIYNSMLQSYTIENARSTLSLVAETQAAGTQWGNGPGTANWLPSGITADTDEHWLWNVTTTEPPTEACAPSVIS